MKLLQKIWHVFRFNLPITIFTFVWLGAYIGLVELNIFSISDFTILGIWLCVWLFMLVVLIDWVDKKSKKE